MSNQKGFAPILIVFAVAAVGVLFISADRFVNSSSQKVAGFEIAKGDDDSGSSGEAKTTSTPAPTTTTAQEIEDENEQETENEREVETADVGGEFHVKVNDGEFELEAKEATEASRLSKLRNANAIKVKLNGKNVELQAENDHINLKLGNIQAETKFPLTIDQTTGQLMVITPNGPRPIRVLPDSASEIARNAGIQTKIESLEILSSTSATDSVVIKVKGAKIGSFLGLIPVNEPVEIEVGAQTGKVVSINQPFWLRLLSPLIR